MYNTSKHWLIYSSLTVRRGTLDMKKIPYLRLLLQSQGALPFGFPRLPHPTLSGPHHAAQAKSTSGPKHLAGILHCNAGALLIQASSAQLERVQTADFFVPGPLVLQCAEETRFP